MYSYDGSLLRLRDIAKGYSKRQLRVAIKK